MAVVNGKSNLFPAGGGADAAAPDPHAARGVLKFASFLVSAAASDSSGSDYLLCEIPADALLDVSSFVRTDLWAFAAVNIGSRANTTILANAVARGASATYLTLVSQLQDVAQQPAWQALGYSARPASGVVQIYATASAAATVAGTLQGKIGYRDMAA